MSYVTYDSDEVEEMREEFPEWFVEAIEELYHEHTGEILGDEEDDEGELVSVEEAHQKYEVGSGEAYWLEIASYEYDVFKDFDVAEKVAINYLKRMIEEEPEIFRPEFLQRHMYVTPTDARIIGSEEADRYVHEMGLEEAVEMAEIFIRDHDSPHESELSNLIDEYDKLDAQYRDEDDEDRIRELEEEMESKAEEIQDLFGLAYSEYVEERLLKDPVGYFVDELGVYSKEELFMQHFIGIDAEDAAEDAVMSDGVEHYLEHFGELVTELRSGAVALEL